MKNYKIIGPRSVAGRKPGETVSEKDLDGANVEALIAAGHLSEATPTTPKTDKPAKGESVADPAPEEK